MVREGQKRKNRGSSPKIDKSPQLAVLNNLNGSSPFILPLLKFILFFGDEWLHNIFYPPAVEILSFRC